MAHLVYATQAAADAFAAGVNADFGYPVSNVTVRGDKPAARGQTTRYAAVLKHPSRSEWAYPEDPIVAGKEGRVPIGSAARQNLDATWNGAVES